MPRFPYNSYKDRIRC
ncbi:hypothetical protein CFP56_004756 [Quercus suber]|uniref:Uncharacterized protein n=1 Tax=Quercus suber TaxID=58331 RepID=A0AAW0M8N7_QUESU